MTEAKGRVLIVDDEPDVREVTRAMLELNGFEVHVAADGIDALDLRQQYDVVLLDLQMPVFDGEQLMDYWQMTNPGVVKRVVLMTGYSHRKWRSEVEPFAILHKPFRYEELLRVVQQCTELARPEGNEQCQI